MSKKLKKGDRVVVIKAGTGHKVSDKGTVTGYVTKHMASVQLDKGEIGYFYATELNKE
jgi:translation elongation factor EF-4